MTRELRISTGSERKREGLIGLGFFFLLSLTLSLTHTHALSLTHSCVYSSHPDLFFWPRVKLTWQSILVHFPPFRNKKKSAFWRHTQRNARTQLNRKTREGGRGKKEGEWGGREGKERLATCRSKRLKKGKKTSCTVCLGCVFHLPLLCLYRTGETLVSRDT